MPVAAKADELLGMRAADGWVWNALGYVFYPGNLSEVRLGMDHYTMSFM
jgi:hypothetical protein